MNPNPFASLLHSRKFWLLILDTLVSGIVTVSGWYLDPQNLDKVISLVGLLQPVFFAVIVGIFAEDNAERRLQASRYEADAWLKTDPPQNG